MQKLQLSIPEPCHENWEQMTPTDQGRFCNACAKEVIDFSTMTDIQVLNYFTNLTHEKVCGRAWPGQLNKTISRPEQPRKRLFWYWNYIVMFFMFFGKVNNIKAQGGIKHVSQYEPNFKNNNCGDVYTCSVNTNADKRSDLDISPGKETKIIRGGVSNLKEGVGVIYVVDGIIMSHSPDIDPDDVEDLSVLQAAAATAVFGTQASNGAVVITTRKQKIKNLDTVVVASEFGTRRVLGMVGMMGVTASKIITGKPDQFAKADNDNELKVYPNPVQRGNAICIVLKLKKTGLYQIQIIDAAGQIVLQKKINAMAKEVTEKILADSRWSGGVYYISLVNNKKQLISKTSFIFQ